MKSKKLLKISCEVCGFSDKSCLHYHHIVEQTELNTDNSYYNLTVLCSNCHNKVHHGQLKIIGVYPSTKQPQGRTVIFEENGVKNLDIDEPYYVPKPKSMKIYEPNK